MKNIAAIIFICFGMLGCNQEPEVIKAPEKSSAADEQEARKVYLEHKIDTTPTPKARGEQIKSWRQKNTE